MLRGRRGVCLAGVRSEATKSALNSRIERAIIVGGGIVYVACSTLCFQQLPLDQAIHAMREMQFSKVDLAIHEGSLHLTPSQVAQDVSRWAQRLKALNLPIAAFHLGFAQPTSDAARDQLRALSRLARLLAVPVLTVQALPIGTDPAIEVARLQEWNKIAEAEGLILCLETRNDTLTADVACTMELCRRVHGLGLTLDPSHYMTGPHAPVNYEPLFAYVRHVRLRDSGTKPGEFQIRIGQGEIEYSKVISSLERFQYDRALTVDLRDNIPECDFPIEPEVRKLKYLLESLI